MGGMVGSPSSNLHLVAMSIAGDMSLATWAFTHPIFEGWNDPNRPLNKWMPKPGEPAPAEFPTCANGKDGEGCCHTSAYMAVIDQVRVPNVPPGDYVLRWRWDCEMSPQIWANCADVTIKADVPVQV